MSKANINLIKFRFYEKYAQSYFIVFIDKELKMFLFAKNRDIFAILANELVGNVIQVNTKYIYIF